MNLTKTVAPVALAILALGLLLNAHAAIVYRMEIE